MAKFTQDQYNIDGPTPRPWGARPSTQHSYNIYPDGVIV